MRFGHLSETTLRSLRVHAVTAVVALGWCPTLAAADTSPLPTLSTLFEICADLDQPLSDRVAVFEGFGFEPTQEPIPLWHVANNTSVSLYLNSRVTAYNAASAKANFGGQKETYPPRPRIAGQDWAVMALPDQSGAVYLFKTDSGLTGCDIALNDAFEWSGFDMPLRKEWVTEAGTMQSYLTPFTLARVEATIFTPIWSDWFNLENPAHIWLDISNKPPELNG